MKMMTYLRNRGIRSYLPVIAIGLMVLINSCSKQGPAGATGAQGATGTTGATGPVGPAVTGTITGYVILHDQYGDNVTSGLNSVYVLLYSTSTTNEVDSV